MFISASLDCTPLPARRAAFADIERAAAGPAVPPDVLVAPVPTEARLPSATDLPGDAAMARLLMHARQHMQGRV